MNKPIEKVLSTIGITIAVILFAASVVLFYAQNFIHTQVTSQLRSEKIMFPEPGSAALTNLPEKDKAPVAQYAGQQLLNGAQAKVYADNYIGAHLQTIGGGKTYAELSEESRKDPSNSALSSQVESVFRGQTLRGLLLNAYAFDTMASVALYVAWGVGVAGVIIFVLSLFGYSNSKKPSTKRKK
jgi:hypothetical protein